MSRNVINVNLLDHTVSTVGLFKYGGAWGGKGGAITAKEKKQRSGNREKSWKFSYSTDETERTSLFALHVKV